MMLSSIPRVKVMRYGNHYHPNNTTYKIALPHTLTRKDLRHALIAKDHCFTMNFYDPVESIDLSLEFNRPLIIADYYIDFDLKELKKVDFVSAGSKNNIVLR